MAAARKPKPTKISARRAKPGKTIRKTTYAGTDDDILNFEGTPQKSRKFARLSKPKPKKAKRLPPLKPEKVFKLMQKHLPEFKTCNLLQQRAAPMSGTMKVRFQVQADGKVRKRPVVNGAFRGTRVARCTFKVIKQIRFPRSSGSPKTFQFQFTVR